ncbi:RNA-binding protein [Patescibacteria group bacterium]|nr:RNA-binding protein [Patescibacteria group bacterium]
MSKKLFVGGLSYETTGETLKEAFAQIGTVESANVITDKISGRSKGFGFVEMSSEEEAKKAIETLNGKEIDGRNVTVNEAKPLAPR